MYKCSLEIENWFHGSIIALSHLWAVDEDVDGAVAGEQEVAEGDHHIQDEDCQIGDAEI